MFLVNYSHCNPVAYCRVFVVYICFDAEYCVSLLCLVEVSPKFQVLINWLVPAWAGPGFVLELFEIGAPAGAHVRLTKLYKFFCVLVVNLHSVALNVLFIPVEVQPLEVLLYALVGVRVSPSGVCVLDSQDELASIAFNVFTV